MVKKTILLILCVISVVTNAGKPLKESDYIGHWWTDSAHMKEKNQKLVINENYSVQWTTLKRDGGQYTLKAEPENVKIIDEFLYVTFPLSINPTLNKMVISGWKNKDRSRIFGTLFMYINEDYMSTGVPIAFESGEGNFLPSKVRKVFSNNQEVKSATNDAIVELIEQLRSISADLKNKEPHLAGLLSKKPFVTTIYTITGHTAHPAVFIATRKAVDVASPTNFRTVFLGDEVEAKKLHNELKLDFKSGYKDFNSELNKFLNGKY